MVASSPYRTPLTTARFVSEFDHLSDGQGIIGFGVKHARLKVLPSPRTGVTSPSGLYNSRAVGTGAVPLRRQVLPRQRRKRACASATSRTAARADQWRGKGGAAPGGAACRHSELRPQTGQRHRYPGPGPTQARELSDTVGPTDSARNLVQKIMRSHDVAAPSRWYRRECPSRPVGSSEEPISYR
jgi:hypothetical protein